MRVSARWSMLLSSFLMAAASSLSGCATTGVERTATTTNTMQTVEGDYRQVVTQVDSTNSSLQELIRPNQNEMKKALESYTANVASMEAAGKELNAHISDMGSQRLNYFAEWQKQGDTYTNPVIRQLSEERRLQLSDSFAQIAEASIGVKGSLHSYLVDIREIEKYLSTDLTPTGVEAITPVAQKATRDGEDLKRSVKPILEAIDRTRTAMAQ